MTAYFSILGVYFFIIGACIGSFLNVCIYRIPANKSIVRPGSFCPNCKTSLPFYCNVPILSYLFLKGRCKFCNIPISIRYPSIELLTGIFGFLLFHKFGLTPALFYWLVFTSVLITISFIDIDHQIIPDVISLPGILIFSCAFYFLPEMTIKDSITGILVGGGGLYAVALLYYLLKKQEGMGGGDIKLLAMIGAASGLKGVLFTVFAGSLFGTVSGILILACTKGAKPKLKIPFGPFLSAGIILYIFSGKQIIQWYMGLLIP